MSPLSNKDSSEAEMAKRICLLQTLENPKILLNKHSIYETIPIIFKNAASNWPAVGLWTPNYFKQKFSEVEAAAHINLPENNSPYLFEADNYTQYIKITEFIDLLLSNQRCYIAQEDTNLLINSENDYKFEELIPIKDRTTKITTNLWIGYNTSSGLHFDSANNFLVQIYGEKQVFLIAPQETRYLSPITDNIFKSSIDPMNPDYLKYPLFKNVTVYEGIIKPGDVLYIPKGWWHYIYSPKISFSLNCWYGKQLELSNFLNVLFQSGINSWLAFIRDFIWHGIFKIPYKARLFSPPPTGKIAFDYLLKYIFSGWNRREKQ